MLVNISAPQISTIASTKSNTATSSSIKQVMNWLE
jgi:hypothetical protein